MFKEGKITKSKLFFISSVSFILGVAAGNFFVASVFTLYLLCLGSGVILLLFWDKPLCRAVFLTLIFFFLGMMRILASAPEVNAARIEFYNNREISFLGTVIEELDVRDDQTKITLKTQKLSGGDEVSGRTLISVGIFPEYKYGDALQITCKLKTPEPIEDFKYDKYLERYNIYSLCYYPEEIVKIGEDKGNFFKAKILDFKNYLGKIVNQILPEPQASFLGGILYGSRRGIPEELAEDFNRTGITHIIAISGYNITILAVISGKLLQGFYISRKKSFWITVLFIIFFVILTGASASVVRAAVMGILALLAAQAGRLSRIGNVLIFAAALMLLINPKVLLYDAGWQLSFLATLGLVYLTPLISVWFKNVPEFLGFKESFISTISAIIFTLPLILFNFKRLSIVAPLVNMLVLPVIPAAMAVGFAAVILGVVFFPFGQVFAALPWFLLTYIIKIVEIFSGFSWSSIEFSNISPYILLVYLLFPLPFVYKKYKLQILSTKSQINSN